jgi:DNA-binding MarR family transcriptional regulator
MPSKNDILLAQSLREMVKKLHRRIRKKISDARHLSDAEENVVRILFRTEYVLPSQLCTQLGLSSQFVSQVLNKLEALGHISRQTSKEDKRKILVSLSPMGRNIVENLRQETTEWMAAIISKQYTAQQKEIIRQAVELLSALPELS